MQRYRYLIAILPSPALAAEVTRRRAALLPAIGPFGGSRTAPHITLCLLDLPDGNEAAIMEAVADGVASCPSFNLRYSGITHFPERRTIYIDPVQKNDIGMVRSAIIAMLMADPGLRNAVRETKHPHLTIAAGLKPVQFNTAWALLAPHEHASEERVSEVVLLKRLLREGERYEPLRTFALRG